MNINLTPIFEAVIALIAALITCKLIPWIKSKTSAAQYEHLRAAAKVAVYAMEQLYGAGNGDQKLRAACEYLSKQGFDVDTAVIEAAVAEYFNFGSTSTLVTVDPDNGGGVK